MADSVGDLLKAAQADLNDVAGITRKPRDAAGKALGLPPLWVDPEDGVPAPGETDDATADDAATVLGLIYTGGPSPRANENWHRLATLDLWIRAKGNRPTLRTTDLDSRVRQRWVGNSAERVDFDLAPGRPEELRVIQCSVWRELQRLASAEGAGYTYIASYLFELYTQ